jgi:hypothetical protein
MTAGRWRPPTARRCRTLTIAPALEPYFTTGHHDDEQGLGASYLARDRRLRRSGQFLVNTPTIGAALTRTGRATRGLRARLS